MPKKTFFNLPESKRKHIIDVALEEFAKTPYQETSINRLIKRMEIPTGSFYQYFEDKKDLYFYIMSFYVEDELREIKETKQKINLLEPEKNTYLERVLPKSTQKMKYFQEVFIDNFNQAPIEIKRDWTFDKLIGGKYMELYDYSFFEQDELDERIKEHQELMMGIALALPNVVQCFCGNDVKKEWELYVLCMDIFRQGLLNYKHS